MVVTKFWTVKDGQLGTAHISRNGETVGFMPARLFLWSGNPVPCFEITPTDGWTPSVKVTATECGRVLLRTSNDGEAEEWRIDFTANHLGVRIDDSKKATVVTQLGIQRRAERVNKRSEEVERRKEREPQDRAELETWLNQRLAHPIVGGQRTVGRFLSKPSRARWAVGLLIDNWLREFPLQNNQFAKRIEIFQMLQKRSGKTEQFAGGRLVQEAVLRADDARRAAAKEVWLKKQT